MKFFTKKLTYKSPVKIKGYPEKVNVDVHGLSDSLKDLMSIPFFDVRDGNVIIGFIRKGEKTAKAFGLHDMKAVLALRKFMLQLTWTGKEKEVLVSKPLLLKIHAELAVGTDPGDDAYLRALLEKLGLNDKDKNVDDIGHSKDVL